jgi:hypothetical protein
MDDDITYSHPILYKMNNENVKVKMTPKDFFIYIATMAALYVSTFSLLALLFEYIDILFPDRLEMFHAEFSGAVRSSMASLIIVFPSYIALTHFLNRGLRRNPEKKGLGIRKWLIYLTLFIAGITIIVDLVVLVNTFLGGELTTRFILKILSVLIIIGAVFGYYLYDLKGKWEIEVRKSKIIGGIVSLLILASIVSGFFIVGSPQTQRLLRFDSEKVNALQNIQYQVVNYWQLKGNLPQTLADLEDPILGFVVPVDPQTGEEYKYAVLAGRTFELCAEFNKESAGSSFETTRLAKPIPVGGEFGFENANWQHGEGEKCFERTIDPDLFPPRKEN